MALSSSGAETTISVACVELNPSWVRVTIFASMRAGVHDKRVGWPQTMLCRRCSVKLSRNKRCSARRAKDDAAMVKRPLRKALIRECFVPPRLCRYVCTPCWAAKLAPQSLPELSGVFNRMSSNSLEASGTPSKGHISSQSTYSFVV